MWRLQIHCEFTVETLSNIQSAGFVWEISGREKHSKLDVSNVHQQATLNEASK